MNKTKILAFIALAAMLSACGSNDGSPPELVNSHDDVSPLDTLWVKFNSNLADINDDSNIILNQGKRVKTVGKVLGFVGTKLTPGGLPYFDEGIKDSIVFKDIKNTDGYTKERTVFYFSTYPILDKEPNGKDSVAGNIDSLGDIRAREIKFAGVLDHNIGTTVDGDVYDMEDNYTLKLKAADNVSITVVTREALSITVKGPKGITDKTFQAAKGKNNPFSYIVSADYLIADTTLNAGILVPFYIKVSDNATTSPPNPYTISIKVAK